MMIASASARRDDARGGLQLRADGGELLRRDVLDVGLAATDRGHLGRRSCRRRSRARRPRRTRRPAEGRRSRAQRCRWSCFLLDGGSCDSLTPCRGPAPRRECSPAISSAICSPSASRSCAEQLGRLGVAVLGRLELEHAVTRPQLEVERQRPQQVLKGLVQRPAHPAARGGCCSFRGHLVGWTHGAASRLDHGRGKVVFARGGGRVLCRPWGGSMPH